MVKNTAPYGLLIDHSKARSVLHLLELDWPIAFEALPAAIAFMEDSGVEYSEIIRILVKSLMSYMATLGQQDLLRLKGFIKPLMSEATSACTDSRNKRQIASAGNVSQQFSLAIMPPGTPLHRVWRDIEGVRLNG